MSELAALRFDETELREDAGTRWATSTCWAAASSRCWPATSRRWRSRLASVASRLEGLPAVLAAARRELGSLAGRPPSRLHTEMAIKQLPGIVALAEDAVAQAEAAAGPAGRGASRAAAARPPPQPASAAIGELRGVAARRPAAAFHRRGPARRRAVRPQAAPHLPLGPDRRSDHGPGPRRVRRRSGRDDPDRPRDLGEWVPGEPLPTAASEGSQEAADSRTVAAVTAAIGRAHHPAAELVEYCRESYRGIVEFCRSHDVITVPDEPLEIDWTPPFLREFAGAMLDSPGPLDKGQKTFYFMTPPPEDWTPEQVDSYLAEENDRQIDLTTIHEGTPGHYLQLVYSNRCPSLARAVFGSGVFIEGWAVYVTQVMMDLGFRADDPALMLIHWKFYLRAITNAMIDIGIHAGSMTEQEAMDLMVKGGFQEESEARKKWDRARLTSTQLSTYFVGSMEMWSLERERRVRAAVASGDPRGAAAVPPHASSAASARRRASRTRTHLESVIAHGSPPIPLIRRILLGVQAASQASSTGEDVASKAAGRRGSGR